MRDATSPTQLEENLEHLTGAPSDVDFSLRQHVVTWTYVLGTVRAYVGVLIHACVRIT